MLFGSGLSASPAQAAFTVTLTEQDNNVVATGRGTIDTTELISIANHTASAGIHPSSGVIYTGPTGVQTAHMYDGVRGLDVFGMGPGVLADSGSGNFVGVSSALNALWLPVGYVSGSLLSDISTYDNQSFSSLHLTPGTYNWDWGAGAHEDTFTLAIGVGAAVPEPSSLLLFGLPLGLVVLLARPRRGPLA